jgi:peptidoglycan hydrolase CwlO-like protein
MNDDLNNRLTELLSEFNLVAYKLQNLSVSFDKLIGKVDILTEKISETNQRQLLDRKSIETLEVKQDTLDKKIEELDNQIVSVKISLAEKVAWGSFGGGLGAVIIKILENALGS